MKPAQTLWGGRLRELLDFLLPSACLGCGTRMPLEAADGLVCGVCLTRMRPPPWPRCSRCGFPLGTGASAAEDCLDCREWPKALARAQAAYVLEPPVDALVHALKYGGWSSLAEPMGLRMARMIRDEPAKPGIMVVPVPTTVARKRRRGYNQAELLAGIIARVLGFPMVDGLVRTGKGATQVSLHPQQRRANVENAFSVPPEWRDRMEGAEVLLVDDVLTTGATAGAAAQALHEAGADRVSLAAFARALPFSTGSPGQAPSVTEST